MGTRAKVRKEGKIPCPEKPIEEKEKEKITNSKTIKSPSFA
jgi:hypothetical protein